MDACDGLRHLCSTSAFLASLKVFYILDDHKALSMTSCFTREHQNTELDTLFRSNSLILTSRRIMNPLVLIQIYHSLRLEGKIYFLAPYTYTFSNSLRVFHHIVSCLLNVTQCAIFQFFFDLSFNFRCS